MLPCGSSQTTIGVKVPQAMIVAGFSKNGRGKCVRQWYVLAISFFAWTDSAPHTLASNESGGCGYCAGVYAAHAAVELYVRIWTIMMKQMMLMRIVSNNGSNNNNKNNDTIMEQLLFCTGDEANTTINWHTPKEYR